MATPRATPPSGRRDRAVEMRAAPAMIIEHPDVRRMLMTMKALTDGCRALGMECAAQLDISRHA